MSDNYIEKIQMPDGVELKIPGVPTGGNIGQVLMKSADDDYALDWASAPTVPIQYTSAEESVAIDMLTGNSCWTLGTITNLVVSSLDEDKCIPEATIMFTSGSSITVAIPTDVKIMGAYSFEAYKSYVMCFWNNTVCVAELVEQA